MCIGDRLQLLLKGLRTLGRTVLTRGASVLLRTAVLLGTALAPLRLLRPLDGKADLARRVNADDLDLDVLPLRQMIVEDVYKRQLQVRRRARLSPPLHTRMPKLFRKDDVP